ncbi:Phosphoribosylformylglycinamidine synthase 2 [Rhizobium tibeticum]|nr:Phosphoribosylformylglycinamidine synthase 2 [Rhizobium tibeticum]
MMLSESQERMLMVLQPEKEAVAKAIFVKWGLDFAIVGKTTDDLRFRVVHQGEEVANLPIKDLGDQAPEYDRPWREPDKRAPLPANLIAAPADYGQALLQLVGSPNQSSRRWVYEQYDTLIQGNSLQLPGGDAGVVRVENHASKALAFSSDVTPRYVEADPFEGGKQAVAECWRNITATGAEPLAATDNLNFGNPEKPEIMGQFVQAVKGIGEACRVLDFPIVSGNVSLYNETNGVAILPTPTIAGVGLLPDWKKMARIGSAANGDKVIMIGTDGSHLGSSIYLRDVIGSTEGPAPEVDLFAERRNGEFVRSVIRNGQATACHDISSGGLVLALAEMVMASSKGLKISLGECRGAPHALLFGEDQARYVLTVPADVANFVCANAEGAGIPFRRLGTVEGNSLVVDDLLSLPIQQLRDAHESWFPDYMEGHGTLAATE